MVTPESNTRGYNAEGHWGDFVWVGVGAGGVTCDEEVVLLFYWVWAYFYSDLCAAYTYAECIENLLLVISGGLRLD